MNNLDIIIKPVDFRPYITPLYTLINHKKKSVQIIIIWLALILTKEKTQLSGGNNKLDWLDVTDLNELSSVKVGIKKIQIN